MTSSEPTTLRTYRSKRGKISGFRHPPCSATHASPPSPSPPIARQAGALAMVNAPGLLLPCPPVIVRVVAFYLVRRGRGAPQETLREMMNCADHSHLEFAAVLSGVGRIAWHINVRSPVRRKPTCSAAAWD